MDKCPFCGADTRPGDNFCLNCGNRLVPASFSAPSGASEETQASPEEWNQEQELAPVGAAAVNGWSNANDATMVEPSNELPTQRPSSSSNGIEQPARLVLRSDDGSTLQEYPLDKPEISIGRAPNSDILLSKDKLTSRRHATVRYENGSYVLRDERSANGTFVNGQQIEEMVPKTLQEGDHVGIGEHELIFRPYGSSSVPNVEDLPTIAVSPVSEMTYRTREDSMATVDTNDSSNNGAMSNGTAEESAPQDQVSQGSVSNKEEQPVQSINAQTNEPAEHISSTPASDGATVYDGSQSGPQVAQSIPVDTNYNSPSTSYGMPTSNSSESEEGEAVPAVSTAAPSVVPQASQYPPMQASQAPQVSQASQTAQPSSAMQTSTPTSSDNNVNFSRLTSISQPSLPDMTALMAALSTLDGQVMSLQEQLHATQDAMHNHDAEVAQTSNQLRTGVRRVADRMDNTIADVARSREALAWADLSQLMEDVMNNPRDIEYVTKLARKARELNKIFQIHQNVLNTMYECNTLLRGMIGEDR